MKKIKWNRKVIPILFFIIAALVGGLSIMMVSEDEEGNIAVISQEKGEPYTFSGNPEQVLRKMPEKLKKRLKRLTKIPFKVTNKDAVLGGLDDELKIFHENYEFNGGSLEIIAFFKAPTEMKKNDEEEHIHVQLKNGTTATYKDRGKHQILRWMDKNNNVVYYISGTKYNKDDKFTKKELVSIANSME